MLWTINFIQTYIFTQYSIGFPSHFRHLCIQFHQFSIQFRPEKLTAFKSKVQFRQIVIHTGVLSINFKNSAFKFVNCHWNSSVSLARRVRNVGSNASFLPVAYRGSTHGGGGGAPSGKVCVVTSVASCLGKTPECTEKMYIYCASERLRNIYFQDSKYICLHTINAFSFTYGMAL